MSDYDRLSALDETFLHLERPETPMHVGAIAILERDAFYGADGRFRLADLRALVESRLPLIPRFRRRVMNVPFGLGRPIWVDAADFDVARHVKLTSLPAPGTRRQLVALAERLMEQLLDRGQPLWELWLVEGVDRGRHVGLIHKSHHTLTDGISGIDIATALFDFSPEPPEPAPAPAVWQPEPAPEPARLVIDSLCERIRTPVELAGVARRSVAAPREAADRAAQVARSIGALVGNGPIAPTLSINGPIGRGRRIAAVRVPLEPVKAVRKAFGCTVNDVVLAGVGGALARLLDGRGELRADLAVKIFCPVSVRDESERTQLGNRISAMFVPLAVGQPDPRLRLLEVHAATSSLKEREQAVGAATLIGLTEFAAPTLLSLAARAAHEQRFANLIVTNIPGPQVPLYCLGSRMLELYPVAPLSKNLTINIAVMSYCGELYFGLVGDGAAAPDLEVLAGGIEDAFAELYVLASLSGPMAPLKDAKTNGGG
ncbi:MAG TPA: wax ester/triacylglycerol synthase family O-acyltransferase [Acidimicrobiia bacterium]|nr:wax ester/triacylglycerol synthase family O-acyltransferase [Acidimicrobiia bacterium]